MGLLTEGEMENALTKAWGIKCLEVIKMLWREPIPNASGVTVEEACAKDHQRGLGWTEQGAGSQSDGLLADMIVQLGKPRKSDGLVMLETDPADMEATPGRGGHTPQDAVLAYLKPILYGCLKRAHKVRKAEGQGIPYSENIQGVQVSVEDAVIEGDKAQVTHAPDGGKRKTTSADEEMDGRGFEYIPGGKWETEAETGADERKTGKKRGNKWSKQEWAEWAADPARVTTVIPQVDPAAVRRKDLKGLHTGWGKSAHPQEVVGGHSLGAAYGGGRYSRAAAIAAAGLKAGQPLEDDQLHLTCGPAYQGEKYGRSLHRKHDGKDQAGEWRYCFMEHQEDSMTCQDSLTLTLCRTCQEPFKRTHNRVEDCDACKASTKG